MKDPFTETSVENFLTKMSRVQLDETTTETNPCTKAEEDSDLVTPIINGEKYRLKLKSGQLFCCSETGIKFQVESAVTIEYELEYGTDYMNLIQENGYEIVGPLFKIHVEFGAVSAVYLPHYVCLEGLRGDKSVIKCGHFRDGKMTLSMPTKIESSYIVLENPTFSCVAALLTRSPFWKLRKKHTPFRGKVLLYFRILCPEKEEFKEYQVHLYLIPTDKPQLTRLDKLKKKSGFKRIDKPSQTINDVYTKRNYSVIGDPKESIIPETLQFKIHEKIEYCSFIEVTIGGNASSISLSVKPEGSHNPGDEVWRGRLTRGDLEELRLETIRLAVPKGSSSQEHFVNKHRVDLINRVSDIKPILDYLHDKNLLTAEQCSTVCSRPTPEERMRQLYSYVYYWGNDDKDKVYQLLKKNNGPLIRELEDGD